ncbi:MAG TPA: cytochrome c-type biogenesis protein [Ktedonobacteraceae bacterium]|nr:cytochrome c-type biogenesis protein [Ktedonobacteraceae bacterium]
MQKRYLLIALAIVAIVGAIWSYILLTTPPQQTLDQQVRDVGLQLKCLTCQGENVADSPSVFAGESRTVIRQQLQSGKSEQQVIQYFVSRYGNRILLSPQWQGFQLLAWLVPIGMLLLGLILAYATLRTWRVQSADNLSKQSGKQENIDNADLARYREQLERELSAEDPLFAHHETGAY